MTDVFTILRRTARKLAEPPTGGSGRGGTLGTPSQLLDESPPGADQEANRDVSGGGLVGPDDDRSPDDAAQRSPSASAPHRS